MVIEIKKGEIKTADIELILKYVTDMENMFYARFANDNVEQCTRVAEHPLARAMSYQETRNFIEDLLGDKLSDTQ